MPDTMEDRTLAALLIASPASTAPTNPTVSTIPIASNIA